MTTPVPLARPKIDHEGLARAVADYEAKGKLYELRSQSEVMLQDAEGSAMALLAEQTEAREEIARVEDYVERLSKLVGKMKTNEADIGVRYNAQLTLVQLLKQSGVSLPPPVGEQQP